MTSRYLRPPKSIISLPVATLFPGGIWAPDSGCFTRIEFPFGAGPEQSARQEDIDTFETILAQCTAFLERAPPPKSARPKGKSTRSASSLPPYNPSEYLPGEGYVPGSSSALGGGQIVLIDEENGSVVGELGDGFHVVEDSKMKPGSKDPVEITLPQEGSSNIKVTPASTEYLEMAMHPAYQNSTLVSKAAMASRFIVTSSSFVASTLQTQAHSFTQKTKPDAKPLTFTPATHERIRKVHTLTEGAAGLSAKTVGQVNKYAQNFGAAMARRGEKSHHKGIGKDGQPIDGYKPGLLNKSLMAFSTIADGIDQAGRQLLVGTSQAATTVVGHKYGAEAGEVTDRLGGGVKNVGLVYIDATGVSRKAIIRSVAKGMVVGKVRGGGDIIVQGGGGMDGGDGSATTTQPLNWKEQEAAQSRYLEDMKMSGGWESPEVGNNARPPSYGGGAANGTESSKTYGKDVKRRD